MRPTTRPARPTAAAGHDDVKAVVDVTRAQHGLSGLAIEPRRSAQHLADLGMGEIVEEAQLAQQGEVLLLVDRVWLERSF